MRQATSTKARTLGFRKVPEREALRFFRRQAVFAALLTGLAWAPAAVAQSEGRTQALAKELSDLLTTQKLDAIATRLTEDTFAAALFFPGVQTLVVSAKYAAPSLLVEKIVNRQYRDVYMDLAAASVPESKVMYEDSQCDGLRRDGEGRFDIVTVGRRRFRIDQVDTESQPYLTARIEFLDDSVGEAGLADYLTPRVLAAFRGYLGLVGSGPPATAEQLMRSRYSAFAVSDEDYLLRTWAAKHRPASAGIDAAIPQQGKGELRIRFVAREKGQYPFECSRPCGAGHNVMRGLIVVE